MLIDYLIDQLFEELDRRIGKFGGTTIHAQLGKITKELAKKNRR